MYDYKNMILVIANLVKVKMADELSISMRIYSVHVGSIPANGLKLCCIVIY